MIVERALPFDQQLSCTIIDYHQLSFSLGLFKFFMIVDNSFSRLTTRMIVHDSFKPWPNEVVSSRKRMQVELAWRLALGGQTDSQVFAQVHLSGKKNKTFKIWVGVFSYHILMWQDCQKPKESFIKSAFKKPVDL